MTTNPFRPTFGMSPLVWRGRQGVIDDFSQAIAAGAGAPARALVIDGARGIGKTALVNELVDVAHGHGWVSLRTRSTSSISEVLRDTLIPDALRSLDPNASRGKRSLDSVTIAGLGGITTSRTEGVAPAPTVELRLRELLTALKPHGTGVVITIDEVQDADPADLADIAGAYQMLIQEEWDIAIIVTGLSEGVQRLLTLPGTTFMRRAQRFTLGGLSPDDADSVLIETASHSGVSFSPEAASQAAEFSQGYPYLIQLTGYLAWNHAAQAGSTQISATDVSAVLDDAVRTLGEQVHEPSLKGLPTRQRDFLNCMAEAQPHGPTDPREADVAIADVATCMGRSVTALSDLRQRLIDKELIEAADWGSVRFTLPYLGEHLRAAPARRRVH